MWLDCDREGEAIAFDVIEKCSEYRDKKAKKNTPSLEVKRAHFSALTMKDVTRAIENLEPPNKNLSEAVRARQELDLRFGASLTRFQTLAFQGVLGPLRKMVLSWGPCQFPTLGFVVERQQKIDNFKPEPFWVLSLTIESQDSSKTGYKGISKKDPISFLWKRDRLFDEVKTRLLWEKCTQDKSYPTVTKIETSDTYRPRPQPLNTVEATKLMSRQFGISPKKGMEVMEGLYHRGLISYPRTETNGYTDTMNLWEICTSFKRAESEIGEYTTALLDKTLKLWGGAKKATKDDKAHPPIHPVKLAGDEDFTTNEESRVYDLILRHFLASVSRDAVGSKAIVEVDLNEETFTASGLKVLEKNYLNIWKFDTWAERPFPDLTEGQVLEAFDLTVREGSTMPPYRLTEADLVTLMDTQGIGTDATIHEHINTIFLRGYACKKGTAVVPTDLGRSLVELYQEIDCNLYKPDLRASMEADVQLIAEGKKNREEVLLSQTQKMSKIYADIRSKQKEMYLHFSTLMTRDGALDKEIVLARELQTMAYDTEFMTCPSCKEGKLRLKPTRFATLFIGCSNYPKCTLARDFPTKAITAVQKQASSNCESCTRKNGKDVNKF